MENNNWFSVNQVIVFQQLFSEGKYGQNNQQQMFNHQNCFGYIIHFVIKVYINQIQFISMLLVKQDNVKLQKTYQKILYISPAYNNTFAFLGVRGHRQDCFVHCDANGKILFQKVFQKIMDSFGMISQRECIMLQTRQNFITVISLDNYEILRVPFNFMNQQTDQSMIHTFSEKKILCIRQCGRFNDNRFKLSYFHYPLTKDSKPFHKYYSEQQWTYEYIVRQTNNHSQFCWFKGRHDEKWEIFIFDLKDRDERSQSSEAFKYVFPNRIGEHLGKNNTQTALKTMWQARPNEFMLVCDIKTGFVRQVKFTFGKYQPYLIDQKNIGTTSMFRTFDFQAGKALVTPTYYVNNLTQEIIYQDEWKCSYLNKYFFPAYDDGLLIDAQYENGDVSYEIFIDQMLFQNQILTVLSFLKSLVIPNTQIQ